MRANTAKQIASSIGILASIALASESANAAFTYADLVGRTFRVKEVNFSYYITFTSDTQGYSTGGVGYYAPGQVFSYEIVGGAINIPDPEGFTAGSRYTMTDPATFSVQQEVFPGAFEVETGIYPPGITDFTVFNNSAAALKDFFLANGLWEGTITADGQIIHPTMPTVGKWWIENNTFYFNYPDGDNFRGVDRKAYRLENDILYFQTDAGFTVNSTWQVIPDPDSDSDGMPDDWEQANGLIVGVDDSTLDPDGDTNPNILEWLAGTDPQNRASAFRPLGTHDGFYYHLPVPTISGRAYEVSISRNLADWLPYGTLIGDNTTQVWTFDETTVPAGPFHSIHHPSNFFFRVKITILAPNPLPPDH